MGSRSYNYQVKPYLFLYFFCKMSDRCAWHDQLLEHFSWISQHIDQFIIPVLCQRTYKLSCGCFCILAGFLSCEKVMKIIRYMKQSVCLFQIFRMFFLYSHQLVYGIKDLFLDACTLIQLLLWNDLIYFFIHTLCTMISVTNCIAKNLSGFIQKDIVNSPCIYSHAYRDLAQLFTFFQSILDFYEKPVKFPAKLSVLFYHPIFKTVHFFQHHFSIFQMSQDQSSAGCSNVYCQIILCHF